VSFLTTTRPIPLIYFAIVRPGPDARLRKEAVIMFVDAIGECGKIEIGIVVSGKGELVKIHLFENKEPKLLAQEHFLKQFESKKLSDSFKVGSDITAPRGSKRSAQAIASGARRGLLIINEWKPGKRAVFAEFNHNRKTRMIDFVIDVPAEPRILLNISGPAD
jgi:hypothetical protein